MPRNPRRGGAGAGGGGGRGNGAGGAGAAAAGGGAALTAANLEKMLDEREKKFEKKFKALADDVKSTKSAKHSASAARGVLKPPPGSDDSSDDDSSLTAPASSSSDESKSSGSSSSHSASSSSSGRKSRKKSKARKSKLAVATKAMSRDEILKAKPKKLLDIDAEQVYYIPERLSEWIVAPADVEEQRNRIAQVRAFHEKQVDKSSPTQMGSFWYEKSLTVTLFRALSDPSLPPQTRIDNTLALIGCRWMAQAIAAKNGHKKAMKYWNRRTTLSLADPQARRALADLDKKKKAARKRTGNGGRRAGKGGGKR